MEACYFILKCQAERLLKLQDLKATEKLLKKVDEITI